MKEFVKNGIAGVCLSLLCLGVACTGGCQISPAGVSVLCADYQLPSFQSCRLLDASTILLEFNGPVTIRDVHIGSVQDEDESLFSSELSYVSLPSDTENGTCIQVNRSLVRGQEYVLYAVAEDRRGNSVHFSTVVQGFNQTPARVLLSEVRTTYSNPKCEFVELLVLDDGNLAGMVLESIYSGKSHRYVLPDIEVHAGEYVVLHLRKLAENCIDETGDDVLLCTHKDASPGRDIWRNDTTKMIGATGILLVWNRSYGEVIDCLLYAESAKESWPGTLLSEAAQNVTAQGLWTSGHSIDGSACSDSMTMTRTLSRQGLDELYQAFQSGDGVEYPVPVCSDDWFVVATNGASPGKANSTIAYE